jgi:UDP-GlcNAc3NAcA epimerase
VPLDFLNEHGLEKELIKILTVVGARPQFIKASALSLAIREKYSHEITEEIIHTGQHYDNRMSSVFFDELGIPGATYNLNPVLGGHAEMTGSMLLQMGAVVESCRPDLLVVYGDTNSTLAGALAAVKLSVPVAHVEAGMRSRNLRMPEEINRILVDRVSALNFAPSNSAMDNLQAESLGPTAFNVGDIVADVVRRFTPMARISSELSSQINSEILERDFVLATFHRQETMEKAENLVGVMEGLMRISSHIPVVVPTHPRLANRIAELGIKTSASPNLILIPPVGFLDMIALTSKSSVVVTDSGGLQKEAFYMGVPCVTVRSETEWTETVLLGWNRLAEANPEAIHTSFNEAYGTTGQDADPYGKGNSSEKILDRILEGNWRNYFD